MREVSMIKRFKSFNSGKQRCMWHLCSISNALDNPGSRNSG